MTPEGLNFRQLSLAEVESIGIRASAPEYTHKHIHTDRKGNELEASRG